MTSVCFLFLCLAARCRIFVFSRTISSRLVSIADCLAVSSDSPPRRHATTPPRSLSHPFAVLLSVCFPLPLSPFPLYPVTWPTLVYHAATVRRVTVPLT